MVRALSVFAILAKVVSASQSADCLRPAPAFLWAGMPVTVAGKESGGSLQPVYHTASLEGKEIVEALAKAAAPGEGAAEIVALFIGQGNDISTASVASVASAGRMRHCESAHATMPYVYPSAELPSRTFAAACLASGTSVREVSGDGLQTLLESAEGQAMLTNGVPDALTVMLPSSASLEDLDGSLAAAWTTLRAAAGGRAAVAFLVDAAGETCGRRNLALGTEASERQRRRQLTTSTTTTRSILITPDILTAILFLALFVFILMTGVSCLNDIECPKHFVHQGPPQGQEY